jgi:hypothetical protein
LLSGVLATGLVSLLLAATAANAAGFVQKNITCPRSGFLVIPAGDAIEVSDVIISSDGVTDVQLFFNPPKFVFLNIFLDANESFNANFQGQVEGEKDQGLKLTCGGQATVSITVTGTRTGL